MGDFEMDDLVSTTADEFETNADLTEAQESGELDPEEQKRMIEQYEKRLNELAQKSQTFKAENIEKIQKALQLKGSLQDALADCKAKDGPKTEDGQKLKKFVQNFQGDFTKWMENTGKGFFEKYGSKMLIFTGILGAISSCAGNLLQNYESNVNASCYSMTTCPKKGENARIAKVNCPSKSACSCARIAECSQAPCNQPSTGCLNYYWNDLDLETIVAMIPDIADSTYNAPPDPGEPNWKKDLTLFLIIAACLIFTGYLAYKLYEKYSYEF